MPERQLQPSAPATRIESALFCFSQGFNCSQAVLLAYAGQFGQDEETAAKIAVGENGGFPSDFRDNDLGRLDARPDLRELNLLGENLTDAGFDHLRGLRHLETLKFLPGEGAGFRRCREKAPEGIAQLHNQPVIWPLPNLPAPVSVPCQSAPQRKHCWASAERSGLPHCGQSDCGSGAGLIFFRAGRFRHLSTRLRICSVSVGVANRFHRCLVE